MQHMQHILCNSHATHATPVCAQECLKIFGEKVMATERQAETSYLGYFRQMAEGKFETHRMFPFLLPTGGVCLTYVRECMCVYVCLYVCM